MTKSFRCLGWFLQTKTRICIVLPVGDQLSESWSVDKSRCHKWFDRCSVLLWLHFCSNRSFYSFLHFCPLGSKSLLSSLRLILFQNCDWKTCWWYLFRTAPRYGVCRCNDARIKWVLHLGSVVARRRGLLGYRKVEFYPKVPYYSRITPVYWSRWERNRFGTKDNHLFKLIHLYP